MRGSSRQAHRSRGGPVNPVSNIDSTIAAWTDPESSASFTAAEVAAIPESPIGTPEDTDRLLEGLLTRNGEIVAAVTEVCPSYECITGELCCAVLTETCGGTYYSGRPVCCQVAT